LAERKVYVHTGTQSTAQTVPAIGRLVGIEPEKVVFISEYTGGGFGSKITGDITLVIPALLSKKTNAPVMMRISREEEHYIGRGRPSLLGRNGKSGSQRRPNNGARYVCSFATTAHMTWWAMLSRRTHCLGTVSAASNALACSDRADEHSPSKCAEFARGMQGIAIMEPILAKAARKLGVDQVALRRINAPEGKASFGPLVGGKTGVCDERIY